MATAYDIVIRPQALDLLIQHVAVIPGLGGEHTAAVTIELSESVFGIEPNKAVLHASVKNYLANQRQGTQSALTRAEVSGGGRKPWRQKGTGRARQGSTRAPQWTHGGIVFAPKPRSYRYNDADVGLDTKNSFGQVDLGRLFLARHIINISFRHCLTLSFP